MKKNICVFCSSSNQIADSYKKSAFRLGELIAESDNTLIYGGATGGLMSAVAEGAHAKNGEIVGVITDSIVKMGRLSPLLTQTICVKNLGERKVEMKKLADVFVVLPGGYGTLDEMFDIIASGTIGEHKKPLILVNENGFFNHFLEEVTLMKNEKCIPQEESYTFILAGNVDECMKKIINPHI